MEAWRLIQGKNPTHPAFNMALDEALLSSRDVTPVLRFYTWSIPTYSIGYFQDVRQTAQVQHCEEKGIAVIRRMTGGGRVVHGKDITMSLVITENHPLAKGSITDSYARIHGALFSALKPFWTELVMLTERKNHLTPRNARDCFSDPTCHDIGLQGKKVIGSSQRRRGGKLLHQTTLLLPERDDQRIIEAILNQCSRSWNSCFELSEIFLEEKKLMDHLMASKYRTQEYYFPSSIHEDKSYAHSTH